MTISVRKRVNNSMSIFTKIFGTHSEHELKRIKPRVDRIEAMEPKFEAYTDEELCAMTAEFRARLEKGETLDDILEEAFAVVLQAEAPTPWPSDVKS